MVSPCGVLTAICCELKFLQHTAFVLPVTQCMSKVICQCQAVSYRYIRMKNALPSVAYVHNTPCLMTANCRQCLIVRWCRENGRHNIGYELAWRALSSPNRAASQAVRQQCGNHLKSALQYVYQWQRGACDDPGDPFGGVSFR